MYTKIFMGQFVVFKGRILTSMLFPEQSTERMPLMITCHMGITLDFAKRSGLINTPNLSDDCRISRLMEYAKKEGSLAFVYTKNLPCIHNKLYVPNNSPENTLEFLYRYQEYEYRKEDAKRQLNYLVFGDEGDPDNMSFEDWAKAVQPFLDESYPNVTPREAIDAIPAYIQRFDDRFDCNTDENTQWELAIKAELSVLSAENTRHLWGAEYW